MSLDLRIAGLGVRVRGDTPLEPGEEHAPFRVDALGAPDLELSFAAGEPQGAWYPRGERCFCGPGPLEVFASAGEPGWVAARASGAAMRVEGWFAPDYDRGEIRLSPWPEQARTLSNVGELYGLACKSRLARRGGGFLVHALGLTLEGVGGVLLPGSSGCGKSTLADLHAASEVLSDERVALTGPATAPRVHGTPWRGTSKRLSAASAPLAAILFLGPHGPPGLRPLARAEAFRRLAFHGFPPFWDREGTEQVLDLVLAVLERVPAGELCFTPDASAPDHVRAAAQELLA